MQPLARQLAALAGALVLIAGSTSAVQALPKGLTWVSYDRELRVANQPSQVCRGEYFVISAAISDVDRYRNKKGRTVAARRGTGASETITLTSNDSSVVSVHIGTATQPASARVKAVPFLLYAKEIGRAKLTFTDAKGLAQPVEVTVEVVYCHYEISIYSVWQMTVGFRPVLIQSVSRVRLDEIDVGVYAATPNARNSGTTQTAGGCTVTFEIANSAVLIGAKKDPRKDPKKAPFAFEIRYAPIGKATPTGCHIEYLAGSGSGNAEVEPLNFRLTMVGNTGTRSMRHGIDANGRIVGTTTVTVTKVKS
jgi:hypothetical protein